MSSPCPPTLPINPGMPTSFTPGPTYPTTSSSPMPLWIPDPSIKGASFDQLLAQRGVRFLHRKATPCPNMGSLFDNSHDPNCSHCDGNGILYYFEKEIWGIFYSNSLEKTFEMQGVWEIGHAIVTLPTIYPDGTVAEFNTYDQLVIADFSVRLWQLIEYKPRITGNSLRYPILSVEYMAADVNGTLVEYVENTHYNIVNGKIIWISGAEPAFDSTSGIGEVITIQYHAYPVYNVLQHMRELRITQELVNGSKVPQRLPQQLLIRRDFFSNPPERR